MGSDDVSYFGNRIVMSDGVEAIDTSRHVMIVSGDTDYIPTTIRIGKRRYAVADLIVSLKIALSVI